MYHGSTVLELTVVVVPLTVKLPPIVTLPVVPTVVKLPGIGIAPIVVPSIAPPLISTVANVLVPLGIISPVTSRLRLG